MTLAEDLLKQILQLPEEQRAWLRDQLDYTEHSDPGCGFATDELRAAWIEECKRRSTRVESGESKLITMEEFKSHMDHLK